MSDAGRDDLYALAALLADLDRVLNPLPIEEQGDVSADPAIPPPLPPVTRRDGSRGRGTGVAPPRRAPAPPSSALPERPRPAGVTSLGGDERDGPRVAPPASAPAPPAGRRQPVDPQAHARRPVARPLTDERTGPDPRAIARAPAGEPLPAPRAIVSATEDTPVAEQRAVTRAVAGAPEGTVVAPGPFPAVAPPIPRRPTFAGDETSVPPARPPTAAPRDAPAPIAPRAPEPPRPRAASHAARSSAAVARAPRPADGEPPAPHRPPEPPRARAASRHALDRPRPARSTPASRDQIAPPALPHEHRPERPPDRDHAEPWRRLHDVRGAGLDVSRSFDIRPGRTDGAGISGHGSEHGLRFGGDVSDGDLPGALDESTALADPRLPIADDLDDDPEIVPETLSVPEAHFWLRGGRLRVSGEGAALAQATRRLTSRWGPRRGRRL